MEPEGGVAPPQSDCQVAKQVTGGWGRIGSATSVHNGPADVDDGADGVLCQPAKCLGCLSDGELLKWADDEHIKGGRMS